MFRHFLSAGIVCVSVCSTLVSLAADPPVVPPKQGKSETIKLFNGKDLEGWEGHAKHWSVKDGVIVGKNTEKVPVSTYLVTKRKFSDFRLVFSTKLVQSEMHSGIAMWGRVAPEKGDPFTYQGHLVMFPSGWGLYDLYGRNGLPVDPEPAKAVGKQHDWNHLEILAQGNRIRLVANGAAVVDWRDPEPQRIMEGPIGLQLHSNEVPQEVQFKDLVLTTFPEDKLQTLVAQRPVIELWPSGAPGAKGKSDNDKPTITAYLPPADKATGAAVVVCPGGGYGFLAMGHEGKDVAEWLNSLGVAAFVLKYRHAAHGYQHPAPLDDAQRALRTVRARAGEWGVDSKRVGILGFSAGGHLASTAGTHFDAGKSDAADPIDRQSCRPDFMVLVYPVVSFTTAYTHQGSKNNLLGKNPDQKLVDHLSNENQVTSQTPPTFLMHTNEDSGVPPENSVLFYLALRRAGVPAEMHIYEKGQHGLGLAPQTPAVSSWPERCADWMRGRGILKKG
jgi:acetyl esterase/lipase